MGKIFVKYLDGRVYSCKFCSTNLAQFDCLISKVWSRKGNGIEIEIETEIETEIEVEIKVKVMTLLEIELEEAQKQLCGSGFKSYSHVFLLIYIYLPPWPTCAPDRWLARPLRIAPRQVCS